MQMKSLLALSIFALAFPAGLWAEDAHHPKPAEETAPAATQAPEMGMGMMAMMPDMMRMMQEMGNPARHVEGRIAFLHAELAITEAQEPLWASLADALRARTRRGWRRRHRQITGTAPAAWWSANCLTNNMRCRPALTG